MTAQTTSCSRPRESGDFLVRLHQATVRRAGHMVLHVPHFELKTGEHWAILGGNGAGKSTFLALLRGELWPLANKRAPSPPRLYSFAQEPTASPLLAKGRMPLVSAELQLTFRQRGWNITALEIVLSGFFDAYLLYSTPSVQQQQQALEFLRRLDAEGLAKRLLPELSQGELRRVLVARALAACEQKPSVLLLDEVCDGLDARSRRTLLSSLEEIVEEGTSLQLCCSSHRREELPRNLTHVARFHDGLLLSGEAMERSLEGTPPSIARDLPLERMFKSAEVTGSNFQDRKSLSTDASDHSRHSAIVSSPDRGNLLLELSNVDVYRNGRQILSDITWRMESGQHWAILGGNGAGKSTLLALICGELHPSCVQGPAGELVRHFQAANPGELRKRIGLVAPHLEAAWDYQATALELVASGLDARIGMHGLQPAPEQLELARSWLQAFGMEQLAERPFGHLSTGQRRRCFLARAMLAGGGAGPSLLLLDEPCAGLDAEARAGLYHLLGRLASRVPLLVASHHHEELPAEITHFLLLEQGRVAAQDIRTNIEQTLIKHGGGAA